MRIDWYNIARTLTQAAIVAIGVALPLLTAEWWAGIGVEAQTVAPVLGAVSLALAAWWRQKYQAAWERPKSDG